MLGDPSRSLFRLVVPLLCLFFLALSSVESASAHASLVRTDPADGALLTSAPRVVTLAFSESVALSSDSVGLFDAQGHPISGSTTFAVGEPSPTVAPPGQVAEPGAPASVDPVALMIATDVVHMVSGAFWLGGIVGIAVTMRLTSAPGVAATTVARFSGISAGVLLLLTLSGSVMAWRIIGWRIIGSWSGLFGQENAAAHRGSNPPRSMSIWSLPRAHPSSRSHHRWCH